MYMWGPSGTRQDGQLNLGPYAHASMCGQVTEAQSRKVSLYAHIEF
jgi:hypothetical protein